MFDYASKASGAQSPPAVAGAVGLKKSPQSEVVIHVMPQDFAAKEAVMNDSPVVSPVVALPPATPPPAATLTPLTKRAVRRSFWPLIVILLLLTIIGAGVAYYVLVLMEAPRVDIISPSVPEPEPASVAPEPEPEPEPVEPGPGVDTDSDGLTNVEELLYGTDFRDPDTDKDTFLDGNEVFHRYDPNGLAPGTLLDTGAVRVYTSTAPVMNIHYPTSWTPSAISRESRVSFRSPSTALVIASWVKKDPDDQLTDVVTVDLADFTSSTTKSGLITLVSRDARIVYVDAGELVYTFVYDLGEAQSIEFLQTFQMMVNSFSLTP